MHIVEIDEQRGLDSIHSVAVHHTPGAQLGVLV